MQQPVYRVGNPMDIANMVLFLCSEKAGFITGENICIDGGTVSYTHLEFSNFEKYKDAIPHGGCVL